MGVAGEGVGVEAAFGGGFEVVEGDVVAGGEAAEALADGGFGDFEAAGDLALGVAFEVEEVPGFQLEGGEGDGGAGHG